MENTGSDRRQILPLTAARLGRLGGRWSVLILLVSFMVLFALVPALLRLGSSGTELWYVAGWIVTSFVSGLIALRVAARCDGSGRKAWRRFGLACLMFMVGNLTWAGYALAGVVLPFQSAVDAFFFASSILVLMGMFHYSLSDSPGSRIQVTNFALALCSAVAVGFIIYAPLLSSSEIGRLGTFVVFSLAALGLSAWTFGLLCFAFYVRNDRRFPFLLILIATGANAVANFFLGFDTLNGTYAVGAFYDVLWIAAVVFMAWAALEHRDASDVAAEPTARRQPPRPAEALIPAGAIAAIVAAVAAARWQDLQIEHVFILPTLFCIAALLALREYALIGAERELRHEAEDSARRLAESEQRLSRVLESTTDGVIVLDTQWRVTFANQRAFDMIAELRLGGLLWELFPEFAGTDLQEKYVWAMEHQTPVDFEMSFQCTRFEINAFPAVDNLSVFFRDVTEQRRLTDELIHLTKHDPLTNLANRRLFGERLAAGLDCGRRRCELTLVLIDIDDFKMVNDLRGHDVGDLLLQQIAGRLAGLVRQEDVVARLGGDEFAIIQPGPAAPDGSAGIARRISEALRAPFGKAGSEFTIGISMGFAMAPMHGSQPEELIRNADLALYRAKETKGTSLNYSVYEPAMANHLQSRQAHRLELLQKPAFSVRPDESPADAFGLHFARLTKALNHVSQGVCMFDADKKLVMCNAQFARMYGIPPEQMQPGTPFRQILQGRIASGQFSRGEPEDYLRERIEAAEEQTASVKQHHLADGRSIDITHCPLEDGGWVAMHDDISERVRIEAQIAHMAHHDALTGLPNRVLLRDELAQALNRGTRLALMCLDLDHFKGVNDALGHPLGDALLREVAERLRKAMPGCDFVSRLGGDTFAVLQVEQHPDMTRELAERIITTVSQPYEIDGHQVIVGVSIGIADAPTDSDDADEILKMAEMALNRCKLEAPGTFRFFAPEMDAMTKARRELELDLRKALAGEEFEIHYQPVVDIEANQVAGFEALLRWNHARRGHVPPGEFVTLAEEIGLIGQLGAWVLGQACMEAAKWPQNVMLAVNVSPAQFLHGDLVRDVVAALERSGLAAERLELEITETTMLQDTGATLASLHSLRDLGVRVSLDDFGTGYSSLSSVRRFPFDRLNIDRSFIAEMHDDDGSLGIVRAILALAKSQGMAVTAEGVETMEQLARLRTEGCREVQGYFFAPARPAAEINGLLTIVSDMSKRARMLERVERQRDLHESARMSLVGHRRVPQGDIHPQSLF